MHAIIIVFLILIQNAFGFSDELNYRWKSMIKFSVQNNIELGDSISEPIGGRIVIGEIKVLNQNFEKETDCLIYQVPAKGRVGTLFIYTLKQNEKCKQKLFAENYLFKKTDIYNLALDLKKNKFSILIDKKKYIFSMQKNSNYSFSTILSESKKDKLKDGSICFDIDDKCEPIIKNRCADCENGYHLIVASQCAKAVRKVCGIKKCGLKNHPACIRGFSASGYEGPYCIHNSPIAYCLEPYQVSCSNEELICR